MACLISTSRLSVELVCSRSIEECLALVDSLHYHPNEVEYSIVMEGVRIESAGRRIDNSLIGRNVVINRRDGLPQTYSFALGDSSQIKRS